MSQLTRNERQERGGSVRRKNKFPCVPWRRRQIDYSIPHHTELGIGVVHGGGGGGRTILTSPPTSKPIMLGSFSAIKLIRIFVGVSNTGHGIRKGEGPSSIRTKCSFHRPWTTAAPAGPPQSEHQI